jgi:hypothetical protein
METLNWLKQFLVLATVRWFSFFTIVIQVVRGHGVVRSLGVGTSCSLGVETSCSLGVETGCSGHSSKVYPEDILDLEKVSGESQWKSEANGNKKYNKFNFINYR